MILNRFVIFSFFFFITLFSLNASQDVSDIERETCIKPTLTTKTDQSNFTPIPDSLLKLPENITVRKGSNGYGLFALKDFKVGDVTHSLKPLVLPYHEKDRVIFLQFSHLEEKIHQTVKMHAVLLKEKEAGWIYYGFDSLMNHSCLPNTYAVNVNQGETEMRNIVIRNINVGDEITNNYNLLYWNLDLPEMSPIIDCNCKQSNCMKQIKGFTHLSQEAQSALAPFVEKDWY